MDIARDECQCPRLVISMTYTMDTKTCSRLVSHESQCVSLCYSLDTHQHKACS
ncbi:hypothetical protein CY34DRAFT_813940 [Suillus luteus UH-Slu-Lm8-n1]|uniref:Uncharacterized protein n=1 Tax=Suillus luteus UH-Slu-Lm8-n1 TaxID=930992 RepID=A0A0D0AFJ7_9AGAM|nr:hypothetical protein CY34DRAFT_813940 [Suillus luteus UH-Slu-Lm8-n1]